MTTPRFNWQVFRIRKGVIRYVLKLTFCLFSPSLFLMFCLCLLTAFSDTPHIRAISLMILPSRMKLATRTSVGVKCA